jgi:hypothetical protein
VAGCAGTVSVYFGPGRHCNCSQQLNVTASFHRAACQSCLPACPPAPLLLLPAGGLSPATGCGGWCLSAAMQGMCWRYTWQPAETWLSLVRD